jgi:putative PIN family toxin of toxin-antitoxin system
MRIVLDTNVLLVALGKKSVLRPIFDAFLEERFVLCVTTDILAEYEEIIARHLNENVASNLLQLIENAPNVQLVTRYYKWNLIAEDPDDNKFVDCAVAANAHYLVSEDKHFRVLKEIEFPRVIVKKAFTFSNELREY